MFTLVSFDSTGSWVHHIRAASGVVKPMPETRNTQQQRPFSGAQRQRRHAQPLPQGCQTEEGLSNLQSVLVNTSPCFPAGNQVISISSEKCREVCPAVSALHIIAWPEPSALLQGACLEATSSANFNLEELVSSCSAAALPLLHTCHAHVPL